MHHSYVCVPSSMIVPMPLHCILGVFNLFIECIKKYIIPDSKLAAFVAIIQSIKCTRVNGRAQAHTLIGPEIVALLDEKNQCESRIRSLIPTGSRLNHTRVITMFQWCRQLHHVILSKSNMSSVEIAQFQQLISDIWKNWENITRTQPTPKCHLLIHLVQWLCTHGNIGGYSESPLESSHAEFRILADHHINCGADIHKMLRRTLANVAIKHTTLDSVPSVQSRICSVCQLPISDVNCICEKS